MPYAKCKDCEHWYPLYENNGKTGLCAANYMHEVSASESVCRNYEGRTGSTYYVDRNGKKVY